MNAFESGKAAGREFFNTGVMPPTPAWVYEQDAYADYARGVDSGTADARYEYLNQADDDDEESVG